MVNKHFNIFSFIIRLYENPPFDIARAFSELLKTLFFAAFYSPIIPFGYFYSYHIFTMFCLKKAPVYVIGYLVVYYWGLKVYLFFENVVYYSFQICIKYNLLRRSTVKFAQSYELSIEMTEVYLFIITIIK